MESFEKRIEAAQERVVPILNELLLDIGGAAYLDEEGRVKTRPVYLDRAPKEAAPAEDIMDAAVVPEQPKTIDQAIAEENLEAKK